MSYDFAEALKVLKAGYKVAREPWASDVSVSVMADELRMESARGNFDFDAPLFWEDYTADDWFTVNPPHIDGILTIQLPDDVAVVL